MNHAERPEYPLLEALADRVRSACATVPLRVYYNDDPGQGTLRGTLSLNFRVAGLPGGATVYAWTGKAATLHRLVLFRTPRDGDSGMFDDFLLPATIVPRIIEWALSPPPRARSVIRPLTDEDLAPLRALAKVRREAVPAADSLVQVTEPFHPGGDDPAWQAEMRRRIAQQFPRDPDGRLSLQTEVLLAPREPDQSSAERGLWYTVTGPERRRDPAVLRVAWGWRTGDRNSHVWEAAPCRWNPDVPEADCLAPSDLPWELIRFTGRDAHLAALLALPDTAANRIARTLLLQDEGRIGEALSLWGIAVDDTVQDWLDGVGAGCERVQEGLRRAALWRFADLVHAEEERLTAWRAAKKGRPQKITLLRLFALPHQTVARKKCLFLTANGLEQIETASEARVPLALWQRPVEIDLRRFGLWKEEEL